MAALWNRRKAFLLLVNATVANTKLGLKNTTFVDVRNATMFAAGHIPGAMSIPFNYVRQSINLGKPKAPSTTKDILCYETTTEKAVTACTYYHTSGKYKNVTLWVLTGGFPAWRAAGLKVEV
ncbi:hypothetical protein GPECTOR_56g371 [Gonium pectorale]|uniref:Rhodanese domain-containing protein n=1 Tax=Gonium pectorale TaxID=33097 RepID=A0A150G6W2_GONPE|nr:hypothetical protein GPECTOR_56g371 [Gonium pectorale]|eukprot:KXZ45275.1 hypothetical protein GPECTOR_56g371 [Gonium pectorale]